MAKIKISAPAKKNIVQSLNDLVALPQVPSLSITTRAAIQNQLLVEVGSALDLSVSDTQEIIKLVLEKTAEALTAHTAAHKKQ